MQQSTQLAPRQAPTPRRNLSPKQIALLPLTPLFQACQKAGLPITEANQERRLYAVNFYCALMPFDFIESFKDLVREPAQILVLADAIEAGVLSWN